MVNESANPRSEADIETAYWVENEVLLRPLAGAVWLHKDDFEEVLLHQIAMHQTERRALVLRLNRSPTRPLPRARLRR